MKKTIKVIMVILILSNAAYYSIITSCILGIINENLCSIINVLIWIICAILCLIVTNVNYK